MDALELLTQRTSTPALRAPAPTAEQVKLMLEAACRAPDHGMLRPYRFMVIEGDGLKKLGELFLAAGLKRDPEMDEAAQKKMVNMPLRAPMIIVAIAVKQEHPKVPEVEQVITAGCAAHAIVQSAFAQDLGAMWRTGAMTNNSDVRAGLGIAENEEIVGFIYLGQSLKVRAAPEFDVSTLTQSWG
jgi:nitroreductase